MEELELMAQTAGLPAEDILVEALALWRTKYDADSAKVVEGDLTEWDLTLLRRQEYGAKKVALVRLLAKGYPITVACSRAGTSTTTFKVWRLDDPILFRCLRRAGRGLPRPTIGDDQEL